MAREAINVQNIEVPHFHRDSKVNRRLQKMAVRLGPMPNNCAFGAWNYHRVEDSAIHL